MSPRSIARAALAAALLLPLAGVPAAHAERSARAQGQALLAQAAAGLRAEEPVDCLAPAGDPAVGSPEWRRRDAVNQYCATLRVRDQLQSPAYGWANLSQGSALWVDRTMQQAGEPDHLRGGVTTAIPGSQSADAFRTIARWTDTGRGRVVPVRFEAHNGADLRGHVFLPPASVPRPKDGFPGVVITDGSVQAYEELYFWAAQDLAEAGYMVMTYDVQGQGDSDAFGEDCPGACSGVPYQQNYNFYQGAEDSLSYFLSTPDAPHKGRYNPFAGDLDPDRVGLAGHSLGASAVSVVGQCDRRVKAIVAWDNLRAISDCAGVTIPAEHRSADLLHAPALGLANDYGFWVQPANSAPDAAAKGAGFRQLSAAGIDSQIVTLRGATHLEYTYIPLVLPASQKGERFASYYTKAWFDRYLKEDPGAHDRLTATAFDDSVDVSAIGTGLFSAEARAAEPADPYAGNIPYKIAGVRVADAVSFYYLSQYRLRDPAGPVRTCADMRKGC